MKSRIAVRLLAWFLLASLVPTVSIGYLAWRFTTTKLRGEITRSLTASANDRARNVETFFLERQRDVGVLALDPAVADALIELRVAFVEHGGDSGEYHVVTDRSRDFLTHLTETFGYYDLFLVAPDGTVVFSVLREDDFGANLVSGELHGTQLARVFENAYTLLETGASDFEVYGPSGVPAAFLAAPVIRDGDLQGVIALQIGTDAINALTAEYTGLGDTGETLLAARTAAGITVVTPTRHDPDAAFSRQIDEPGDVKLPVHLALEGKRGAGIATDYRGEEVLAAWRYLPQMRWAMVVKIDTQEAFAPIRTLTLWGLVIGAATVIAVIILALVVAGTFSRPIARLAQGTAQLAAGDLTARADVDSRDEIGALARSFNGMASTLRGMGQVAEEIAAGNLDLTMEEKGEKDALARSVNQMVLRLRELTSENRRRLAHATGLSELKDALRRGRAVGDVAQGAVEFLCDHTGARVGALYVRQDDRLSLAGSHAYTRREGDPDHFGLGPGEGLVGQVARRDQELVLTGVDGASLRVASGLMDAPSAAVALFPFQFEGAVLGVFELGFMEEPTEGVLAFLRDAADSIGIAVQAAVSRTELEQMLRTTEDQAQELEAINEELQTQQEELESNNEELQAQEEELRQANEELEEKAEELRAQGEELRQANEELEEKARLLQEQQRSIRQQNRKIEQARQELEVRAEQLALTSRYKSEFLANMSHELRTPLNSILILSSLLDDETNAGLTPKQREYANTIHTSGEDLLALINEVLDLAKIESGTMTLEIGEVRFEELAVDLRRGFETMAEQGEVDFSIEIDESLPPHIGTDGPRLKQVLKNLLSNAFKFTEQGGVTLDVSLAEGGWGAGHEVLGSADAVVAFAVTDTGIGISG